ncbi:hotdog fold thioesterase [Serratia symbiotica]|uniref:hotdog fold thioesterase n=1 Tax=Serratia symbiotica TaxID=138074 RepID=UPI002091B208|nr:hotdog fold thioesterase [Serratia symbiotica]USS96684.1 hotdog fold thioesterase [Serratia symbiotica]
MIWTRSISLDELNQRCQNRLIDHLGIKFSALTAETLEATMQVKSITHQPFGLLHGGASVALAESLGSMASWLPICEVMTLPLVTMPSAANASGVIDTRTPQSAVIRCPSSGNEMPSGRLMVI